MQQITPFLQRGKFELFRLWQWLGVRFFRLPLVLVYGTDKRLMAITFSASPEYVQQLRHFWEEREHYYGLERELKVAHDQIVELEQSIKPKRGAQSGK